METTKLVAVVFLVLGVLGLVYGGFTYTKSTDKAKLGPIELVVKDTEHVNVPVWAGVAAITVGGVLLLAGAKKA